MAADHRDVAERDLLENAPVEQLPYDEGPFARSGMDPGAGLRDAGPIRVAHALWVQQSFSDLRRGDRQRVNGGCFALWRQPREQLLQREGLRERDLLALIREPFSPQHCGEVQRRRRCSHASLLIDPVDERLALAQKVGQRGFLGEGGPLPAPLQPRESTVGAVHPVYGDNAQQGP